MPFHVNHSSANVSQGITYLLAFKNYDYLIFREREREVDREVETLMRNISSVETAASCAPPNGNGACNPGLCPDQEANQQPRFTD